MTFASVGSPLYVANASTFSLTPGGVGDLILCWVANEDNSTVFASSLSSSNVTWAPMGTSISNGGGNVTMVLFAGTATSTSAATVTVAWSGATPTDIRIAAKEFSSTVGSWALDVEGNLGGGEGGEGATWESLTPAENGELYAGFCLDSVDAVAGSTSGYTYSVDPAHGNGLAYDLSCPAGTATAPVWGDSTQIFGIMVLVREGTIQYNTGATGATTGSGSQAFTIPSTGGLNGTGVMVGDVMLADVSFFTEDSTTPTIAFSGGGGAWQLVPMTDGSANPQVVATGGIYSYVWAYQRVATSGDLGATVTVTETGSPSGTTWAGVSMAAYTGANQLNPIDRAGGAQNGETTQYVVLPTETPRIAGDWAVYMAGGGFNNGASAVAPTGATQRQTSMNSGGTGTGIADSNGTTGLSAVGGGHYANNGAGGNCFLSGFTICLAPAGVYMVQKSNVSSGFSSNFGSNVTPGDTIVMVATGHQPGSTVTTSAPLYNGAAVTGAAKLLSSGSPALLGGATEDTWLLPNVQSAGTSYSITTNSQSGSYVGIFVYEVLGLGPSPVMDKSSTDGGNGPTDQTSGASGATTVGPEFVVGVVVQDGTLGTGYPPAGWTSATLVSDNSVSGYLIAPISGVSYTYDCGVSGGTANWTAAVATFAASLPGSGVNVNGNTATIAVAAPAGTPSVSTAGVVAGVAVAAPVGMESVSTPGPVAQVAVAAHLGAASVSVPGSVARVTVAATLGTVTNGTGRLVSVSAQASFSARKSVTATASSEFAAGQATQAGLVTLASDRWFPMYPSRGH